MYQRKITKLIVEKDRLMKEEYLEMQEKLKKINKEWERADSKWSSR